jgi:hypothetical protein
MKPSRDGSLAHVGLKSMVSPPLVCLGFLARIVCPAGTPRLGFTSDERNIVIAHVREGTNRVGSSTPQALHLPPIADVSLRRSETKTRSIPSMQSVHRRISMRRQMWNEFLSRSMPTIAIAVFEF